VSQRLLVLLLALGCGACDLGVSSPRWELRLADDFLGSSLDTRIWNTDHPRDFILNQELQAYTPDSLSLVRGVLLIEARRESRSYRGTMQPFASGTITTFGKFSFCYGRFDVRARIPRGDGLWPAAWLLPESLAWPPEIDLFEFRGQEPTRVIMSHHWMTGPGNESEFASSEFPGPDFSEQFHVFSLEWEPEEIRWLVDGEVRHRTRSHIPNQPMYLNIALSVGGTFPGPPTAATPFPARLEVDWVKVYTLATEAGRPTRRCS
jgi:beta-glucanase (GH16 family)